MRPFLIVLLLLSIFPFALSAQNPSIEISSINFFQPADVGTLVDKQGGILTVNVFVQNSGPDLGWDGIVYFKIKDSKGNIVVTSPPSVPQRLVASKTFSFAVNAISIQSLKEGEYYTAVAVLSKTAPAPAEYLKSFEKSFVVKKAQSVVPELPLPFVLLCLAAVVVLVALKAGKAD